jgi:dTDP-4-amino-4,6-dideoxy-D-galactose acyltransferase
MLTPILCHGRFKGEWKLTNDVSNTVVTGQDLDPRIREDDILSFEKIKFDSELFGFNVAKILPTELSKFELNAIVKQLKTEKIKLVYWAAKNDFSETLTDVKLIFCGKRVTYFRELAQEKTVLTTFSVAEYQEPIANQDLESLVFSAGRYSHFKIDSNFPLDLFHKLYRKWIDNSVKKINAKKVLVIKDGQKILAMITLGVKDGRGDIGLLAVDPKAQGKGLGKTLVIAGINFFIEQGLKIAQVVTQGENQEACALYQKCGFKQEKVESYYHLWL